jgi:SEC-C motif
LADAIGGITPSERYLNLLSRRTFLRLWSYSGLYRDQGTKARGGEGAELCDLLVVFGHHVLIFADKDCEFPAGDDLDVAWARWFKRAILRNAGQVWGAERWLRQHPDRVFLDRACTKRFPLPLPQPSEARFHRIVVAHDASGRRRAAAPRAGSLMMDLQLVGDDHLRPVSEGGHHFAVGHIQPGRAFVHVLDDFALDACMQTLDTLTDFVAYLTAKEALIESGRIVGSFGEEELLGHYLMNVDETESHVFKLPDAENLVLGGGHWDGLQGHPGYLRKLEADRISYAWDRVIDRIAGHAIDGTLLFTTVATTPAHEHTLRIMASEPRLRRRLLACALDAVIQDSHATRARIKVVFPSRPGDPYYALIAGGPPPWVKDDATMATYQERRREYLADYCWCVGAKFDDAPAVIGLATEGIHSEGRSWTFVHMVPSEMPPEDKQEARRLAEERGWLKNLLVGRASEYEYPEEGVSEMAAASQALPKARGANRNAPCPCGSGKKLKKCHGR